MAKYYAEALLASAMVIVVYYLIHRMVIAYGSMQ